MRPGGELKFTSWWENRGVAPCYRPFRLALRLSSPQKDVILAAKADLRSWPPGDNLYDDAPAIPNDAVEGRHHLMLGIVDERTAEP